MTGLLGAVVRRLGRDGNGRTHEAPPRLDLPDETFHVIYDEEGGARFAQLTRESSSTYREEYSVAVPRWIARYIAFEAKPGVET